ncbi:MAG: hypothetical protein PUC47_00665 [Oscillospiraceae bacterium]|nr:hypothetical protein [Oscillospiraceae bacterium]
MAATLIHPLAHLTHKAMACDPPQRPMYYTADAAKCKEQVKAKANFCILIMDTQAKMCFFGLLRFFFVKFG